MPSYKTGMEPSWGRRELDGPDGDNVREIRLISVDGQSWYLMRGASHQRLVHADRRLLPISFERLPDELVIGALAHLRDSRPTQLDYLQAYDSQYYSRYPLSSDNRWQRPLPVWRAAWEDGTTIYADPSSGRLLLRVDDFGRWQRILYHGLHSLDFSILMQWPRLRDALVIGLSIVGLAMCITACVLAWRSVLPNKRRHR